jgi:hypothetical protein
VTSGGDGEDKLDTGVRDMMRQRGRYGKTTSIWGLGMVNKVKIGMSEGDRLDAF